MNREEISKLICDKVSVTPQLVVVAKMIILSTVKTENDSDKIIAKVLKTNGVAMPETVVIHSAVDPLPMIIAASESMSWSLAAAEAIWSLVHHGFLVPMAQPQNHASPSLGWTTIFEGGSGESSSWTFEKFFLPYPACVKLAPSLEGASDQFLSEPDLYLGTMSIQNMHREVSEAFREAVKCFRHELYTAAITMLGKASEGAWLELGSSLIAAVPRAQEQKFRKQKVQLENPMEGTFKKIKAVITVYEHQDVFDTIARASGIRLEELRSVGIWSDAVRDSRNTIHFGVQPSIPNTYEKVSALLIGAVPHIRVLYRLKGSADTLADLTRVKPQPSVNP